MKKRNLKKTILAAALAVPVAFSYPGWAVRAQEDGEMSAEIETQEIIQDNIGIRSIFLLKALCNRSNRDKSQLFIQLSCCIIFLYNRIEL